MTSRGFRHVGGVSALAMGIAAASCGLVGPDTEACSAGEFIARCAILEGVVSDASGVPLSGITVGPRYIVDNCCSTTYSTTGSSGRYSLRIARTVDVLAEHSDTLTLFVGASRPGEGWLDSVRALVTFDPSVINEVNIVLGR